MSPANQGSLDFQIGPVSCTPARTPRRQRDRRRFGRKRGVHLLLPRARRLADYSRRYNYGLTRAAYDELCLRAAGHCQCCARQDDNSPGRGLMVDHDHDTEAVRGLICRSCNTLLGLLQTHGYSFLWFQAAEDYLKGNRP